MVGDVRDSNWVYHGVEVTPETKLMHAFASFDTPLATPLPFPEWEHDPAYYCGPPKVPSSTIAEKARALNVAQFSEWATEFERQRITASLGHINWFDSQKMCDLLIEAGFQKVYESDAFQSSARKFKNPKFDQLATWNCFSEAIR
jgi:hypothetical protein